MRGVGGLLSNMWRCLSFRYTNRIISNVINGESENGVKKQMG